MFKLVPIADLKSDLRNARKHGKKNITAVTHSIKEFGQVEALVVNSRDMTVLGGNCRLDIMRDMGQEEVWCYLKDLSPQKAMKLALTLNRSAELATWDTDTLGVLLRELDEPIGIGWDDNEIAAILAKTEPVPDDLFDNLAPLDPTTQVHGNFCPHCGEQVEKLERKLVDAEDPW